MDFYKLSATNNDFIITILDEPTFYKIDKLCDRYEGIGADGYINIDKYFNVSIFNKDGSKAKMCGNGLRCVNKLLYSLTKKKENTIFIDNIPYNLKMIDDNTCSVQLNDFFMLKLENYYLVRLNNSHLIKITDNFDKSDFTDNEIKYCYDNKCNIHIVSIIDNKNIKIKTYEYGVGRTKSCGSGSIASFYCLHNLKKVSDDVCVHTEGGQIQTKFLNNKYYLIGNVKYIYKGEYNGFF